jgi:hypothetical protein
VMCPSSQGIRFYDVAPLHRIESYIVAPPARLTPTVWPLPPHGIPIRHCGPPAGSTLLGLESSEIGSKFSVFLKLNCSNMTQTGIGIVTGTRMIPKTDTWDQTFRCGPSVHRIRLSAIAPTRVLTFHCDPRMTPPPRGGGSSGVISRGSEFLLRPPCGVHYHSAGSLEYTSGACSYLYRINL